MWQFISGKSFFPAEVMKINNSHKLYKIGLRLISLSYQVHGIFLAGWPRKKSYPAQEQGIVYQNM